MFNRPDLSTENERSRYMQLLAEAQHRLQVHNAAKAEREAVRRQQAQAWLKERAK